MRNTIINKIYKRAKENDSIYFLTGDLGFSVIEEFQKDIPDRVINVGISEQNMIGIAAGLALEGKKVFVYSIVPFATMRCFEQIRVDVCCQNLDVTIIGVGGGFAYGTLGTTHHAIEDIAIMNVLPNMNIVVPADPSQAADIISDVIKRGGPCYIRLNRGGEKNLEIENCQHIKIWKGYILKEGQDISILSTGAIVSVVLEAAALLEKEHISTQVVSIHSIKPIDEDFILEITKNKKAIFTVEEHSVIGGLGSIVATILAENKISVIFKRLGVNDSYMNIIGRQEYLRQIAGLSPLSIARFIKDAYEKKQNTTYGRKRFFGQNHY